VSDGTPEPGEALTIEVSRPADGVVLVALAGEVDILSVDELRRRAAELEPLLPAHVVFDLERLTFIDSSGINALVQAVRSIEARGGTGVLAAPSPEARRVFDIIGLSQVVSVVQNREAALRPPPEEPPSALEGAP
jgi:stage II sporulation protein AA (anti-sigma F factor antagonist)